MDRIAIISPDASGSILKNLRALDIEPIAIPKTGLVEYPISGHPDIQVFVYENRVFCHPDISRSFISKIETRAEIIICGTHLSGRYPGDIPYNIACTGSHAFHHRACMDPTVREHLVSNKINCSGISQGYAKCSTMIIDSGSIITSDVSIHRAAVSSGIESLLISPGSIELPGYTHGFIGGATGILDDMVLSSGDLSHHPDYEDIVKRINDRGKKIVPLGRATAVDLGTIFII